MNEKQIRALLVLLAHEDAISLKIGEDDCIKRLNRYVDFNVETELKPVEYIS